MWEYFSAELLARAQFAFTVSFHIVFPAFSIGLASFLTVVNALWLLKRDETYLNLFNHWKKIFAVVFGMGVVSGLVMSYEFGTNWAAFSDKAGPVIGPLLGYEVMSAFFLEAGFLGIMLFGRERVGDGLHMLATAIVALGTLLSAFWILAVNSWMQTPQGHALGENGQFVPVDWWAIIFSPSFPYRFVHMVMAAYLTTAFVVGAVSAWHLLRNRNDAEARRGFSMAMWMALLVTPLQVLAGDMHGLNTLEHQPVKVAAMEGHFDREGDNQPIYVFGIPDREEGRLKYPVGIPYLGSLILTHTWNGQIRGLNEFPKQDWPPLGIVFWSFRVMVGLGFLMLFVGLWSGWARLRGRLHDSPALLRTAVLMGPSGFIALLAGWFTTEVGRQPWIVQGLIRTSEGLSPVDAPAVGSSLLGFIIVYFFVFGAGIYYLLRLMRQPAAASAGGPEAHEVEPTPVLAPHFDPDFLPPEDGNGQGNGQRNGQNRAG